MHLLFSATRHKVRQGKDKTNAIGGLV
jgi:hypothetical protein